LLLSTNYNSRQDFKTSSPPRVTYGPQGSWEGKWVKLAYRLPNGLYHALVHPYKEVGYRPTADPFSLVEHNWQQREENLHESAKPLFHILLLLSFE